MANRILVLGGYGNFGKLICEYLAQRSDIDLIIAGRNQGKADKLCASLKATGSRCQLSALVIDTYSDSFLHQLIQIHADIVIHTCGPFQGQDYHVANACITAGSHYIDLADDRRFVGDFQTLNKQALQHNVIAVSGASSVPGLSSVVIDHYATEFAELVDIDFAIVPGSNVDLGEATLKGILSYSGRPFPSWEQGKYMDRYGWMDNRRLYLGETLGKRWLANVNIPDLELFPLRYPGVQRVRFQAGHELGIIHLSMAFMALLSRAGWVQHWERYSAGMLKVGHCLKQLGSDGGGMVIQLAGINKNGRPQKTIWRLIASSGVGPRIPTISAIILADRILAGDLTVPGASPCLGMFSLEQFFRIARSWGIYEEVERVIG